MEKEKNLIREIRIAFDTIQDRIGILKDSDIDLTIEIGSNSKTVNFEKVTIFEMNIKAKIEQEL
tara:strand:+ start:18314 stop:18505 length:192 start_codon:yes stop_codon:yes gene_type:complete